MARAGRPFVVALNRAANPAARGFHVQKKSRIAQERDAAKREAFRAQVADIDPNDLVFLDEAGVSLALSVLYGCMAVWLYGWGKKGEPLVEAVPAKRGKNLSVLGAFDVLGMVATTSRLGAMTRPDFEKFLSKELLPRLLPGSVLVLDNASIHKGGKIARLVEKAECRLLYLPAYSPDFNPIEMAWAWIKRQLRKGGPRDEAARQQAVKEAIAALPETLAPACFRHCSYLQQQ